VQTPVITLIADRTNRWSVKFVSEAEAMAVGRGVQMREVLFEIHLIFPAAVSLCKHFLTPPVHLGTGMGMMWAGNTVR
jgi:hypothetical protein